MHIVEAPVRKTRKQSLVAQIVLVLIGTQLIFFSSFTALELPTATGSNLQAFGRNSLNTFIASLPDKAQAKAAEFVPFFGESKKSVRFSNYTCVVPVSILIGYVLGPSLSSISVLLFIVSGLLGPLIGFYPFSSGGGLDYYMQPGFGYLCGLVVAAWLCGWMTKGKRTSLSQLLGIATGLGAVHLIGAAYLFSAYLIVYMIEGSKTAVVWQPWIFEYLRNFSWYSLPYDAIFSVTVIGLAFPFRWIADRLMAPDLGPPPGRVRYDPRRIRELV